MSSRDVWDSKPVNIVQLKIDEADEILDAFGDGDGKRARWLLLVAALRWADSGQPVFGSYAEVRGQPLAKWVTLARLGTKAMFVNGLTDADPDAPPAANGHDTQAPSPSS